MHCFLLENYNQQQLTAKVSSLRRIYFPEINKNIKISSSFGDVNDPDLDIANLTTNDTEINKLKNNKTCNVKIIFNKNIEFPNNILEEAILHELIHVYQLSTDVEDFKKENHSNLFLQKKEEIEQKVHYTIRVNLTPDEIVSQEELDEYMNTLKKVFNLIIIYEKQNDTKIIKKLAYMPVNEDVAVFFDDYIGELKRIYHNVLSLNYNHIPNNIHNNIKKNIQNIFGTRDCDIYDNITNFEYLLKIKKIFNPMFSDEDKIPKKLLDSITNIIN